MRLGQAPTLKLFSPLAAAAEKNRTEAGATALNKRPRGSIVNGRYEYAMLWAYLVLGGIGVAA